LIPKSNISKTIPVISKSIQTKLNSNNPNERGIEMSNHLIGLSLSSCTVDWIKGNVHLADIKLIFAGTAIDTNRFESIKDWIAIESKVNPTIRTMPDRAETFVFEIISSNKLIQPRQLAKVLKPVFRANGNWIHEDKWIDWNCYNRANQMCPYCGKINQYVESAFAISITKYQFLCHNCNHDWIMPFNPDWIKWTSKDWQSGND
jgi:hypothetical protein